MPYIIIHPTLREAADQRLLVLLAGDDER